MRSDTRQISASTVLGIRNYGDSVRAPVGGEKGRNANSPKQVRQITNQACRLYPQYLKGGSNDW